MKAKVIDIIDAKTAKVSTIIHKKHKRYGKYIIARKNFIVDIDKKVIEIGQDIEIISSRPISKRKKWIIK